ncbi:ly6/PLAUR domain-containing protein 2-like [Clarias gariepinus]|uniref:ly6/PLAUR domain-containing protein 2-like n=1 Tax=Clarias gariepinus TaxID=13013 RepID=UPI00234E2138|nr:ly6/PLAUR domain-containing protein 2-like [Clarias gariepinus]
MGNPSGLLLFLLSIQSVNSLKCYVCSSTSSNEHCNINTEECQAPLDTCMTTVDRMGDVKAIVKQCSSLRTCEGAAGTSSLDARGNGNQVTCCNSQLCNLNTATSIQLCAWLLTLTLSLLTILIKQDG